MPKKSIPPPTPVKKKPVRAPRKRPAATPAESPGDPPVLPKVVTEAHGLPDPPEGLGKHGVKAWKSGESLFNEGLITPRDLPNWLLFAEAFDEKALCEKILKSDGEYQMTPNGCYVQHPALKRRQQAEAVIRKYSAVFGLIPDARKKRPTAKQGVATRKR